METLSSENERLKEDIACLTNRNADLKKDFPEVKGMNTNLAKALATKERVIQSMEEEKRVDALLCPMQEKELKNKHDEIVSLKEQLYPLLNHDGSLRNVIKQHIIREFCEGDKGRDWFFTLSLDCCNN